MSLRWAMLGRCLFDRMVCSGSGKGRVDRGGDVPWVESGAGNISSLLDAGFHGRFLVRLVKVHPPLSCGIREIGAVGF